jgi:drug/metabolite transporter (DMT)-like permease
MVTVPFHQVIRATTPVFTILLNVMFLSKRYSAAIYLSLAPVILGVALATLGEYNYSTMGFILTLLGTFLAGNH